MKENSRLQRAATEPSLESRCGTTRHREVSRPRTATLRGAACSLSWRHACLILGQREGTQRYTPTYLDDEDALKQAIIHFASRTVTMGIVRLRWE